MHFYSQKSDILHVAKASFNRWFERQNSVASFSVGCSAERSCARTGQRLRDGEPPPPPRVSRFGHGPVLHSRYNRGPWFGLAVRR